MNIFVTFSMSRFIWVTIPPSLQPMVLPIALSAGKVDATEQALILSVSLFWMR